MSIEAELKNWDGKSADDISEIFHRFARETWFLARIIELMARKELQAGTSWLLKRHLDNGGTIGFADSRRLFELLPLLDDWQAKLHLLQCLARLEIDEAGKKCLDPFLRGGLRSDNKFVRAWSYSGFYELAVRFPEYREETARFFEMALRDEAPSVKARIRKLLEKGF